MYQRFQKLLRRRSGLASTKRSEKNLFSQYEKTRTTFEDLVNKTKPRICVVKQDINEDLYCCKSSSDAKEIVESTLLRTGPAALFAKHDAHFKIVKTVTDAECEIWKQRATELKWDTLEFYHSYQKKIPGRDYGQDKFAVDVEEIDWSAFDIVISIDNSIPERICKKFPETFWCYYVREIKTQAYRNSLESPLLGQECALNHEFRLDAPSHKKHVIEFPYHLHYHGCFNDIFNKPQQNDSSRFGVFVDHHTMVTLSKQQRNQLKKFGDVVSPIHQQGRETIPTSEKLARRTIDEDLLPSFLQSRYFLLGSGQRQVFGTAVVEAIAMGALVVGDTKSMRCSWLLSKQTAAKNFDHAIKLMEQLSKNEALYTQQLNRQRKLVNHLCYHRPMRDLLLKLEQKQTKNQTDSFQ